MLEQKETQISDSSSDGEVDRISSVCDQVSERQYKYNTRMATESGLILLGEKIARQKYAKHNRDLKYQYLIASVKELDEFNGEQFVSEFRKCTDKDLSMVKIQSLVRYVSMFKELYHHHIEDIESLTDNIDELKNENTDMNQMVEQYIEELDEIEATKKRLEEELRRHHIRFSKNKDKIKDLHKKLQLSESLNITFISTVTVLTILGSTVLYYAT